jgi:hypothetical protein
MALPVVKGCVVRHDKTSGFLHPEIQIILVKLSSG